MADGLRVIGAGLPRTGTMSLRLALQQLLGGECYHMSHLWERELVDVPVFSAALAGDAVDWSAVYGHCEAAVDWPTSGFWEQLAVTYPRAVIVLSERADPQEWWRSADATVWRAMRQFEAGLGESEPLQRAWFAMAAELMRRTFGPDWKLPLAAIAGYDRWNSHVRATAPADRLVIWRPGDGWAPLCAALGLPEPAEPFPHANTTDDFVRKNLTT